jgi:hypothetical protein
MRILRAAGEHPNPISFFSNLRLALVVKVTIHFLKSLENPQF